MPPSGEPIKLTSLHARFGRIGGEGLRTLVVTVASFATGFILTVLGTEVAGLDPEFAYSVSVLFCTTCNFFAYRYYIFKSSDSSLLSEAIKYFPFFLAFRGFEIVLFWITGKLGFDYRIAYVTTAAISMSLKFLAAKYLIFKVARPR